MTITLQIRETIRPVVEGLGRTVTNAEIRDAIIKRYPGTKANTIYNQINLCTVNSPSRVQYPENSKPRIATDSRFDILYRVDRGQLELYDARKHGIWEIVKDVDGGLHVSLSDETSNEAPQLDVEVPGGLERESPQSQFLFSLERHLRDFLVINIGSLEVAGAPLSIYANDTGQLGVEYPSGVGPIDILAVDASGDFVVFELKLGRGPDAAVGQLARYMGWVTRNLAEGRLVRGIIVAKTVDQKLRYAASIIPNVSLFEYSMSFALEPANELSQK